MGKTVLKRYAPFYISLVVTAIVMVLLFLRPDAAAGLTVSVDTPQNARNGLAGFKLGEPVIIRTSVGFIGQPDIVVESSLTIIQETGDAGYVNITGDKTVDLPIGLHSGTGDDISDRLPTSGGVRQGKLIFTGDFKSIIKFGVGGFGGFGYGYGYKSAEGTSGIIEYVLEYTPPAIAGDYKAVITISTTGQKFPTETTFTVLPPLDVKALGTLYPTSDGEALPRDLVILQLGLGLTKPKDIRTVSSKSQVIVAAGDLVSNATSMVEASKFHESLQKKWDVSSAADFLLPLKVPSSAIPGRFFATVTVEDTAGQRFTTSSSATPPTSPRVDVVSKRSSFNVYLMPKFNFITPGLQCVATGDSLAGLCTGDDSVEFDITKLSKVSNVNPAFLSAIGKTAGTVKLVDIIEVIFAFQATGDIGFPFFVDGSASDTLRTMKVGRGYIVKTSGDSTLDPFTRLLDTGDALFPTTKIPVPIKLTFDGKVIAKGGAGTTGVQLPTTRVERRWNLVGPHAETDTAVGVFLQPVAVPRQKWETLIAFRNLLDVSLDANGDVEFRDGVPKTLWLEEQTKTLLGPNFRPPKGDPVPAGSGFWLFMCEETAENCTGGELLPVLE